MTDAKWTPGPWSTRQARIPVDGEFDWCVAVTMDGEQHVIVEAFGRVAEHVRPNAEANARLISAAPDMAEALAKLVAWENTVEVYIPHGNLMDAFKAARSALAKARGEE